MVQTIELKLFPDQIYDEVLIKELIVKKVKVPKERIQDVILRKRSVDARSKRPVFIMRYDIYLSLIHISEPTRPY